MNKRYDIIGAICAGIILLIAGIVAWNDYASHTDVVFTFDTPEGQARLVSTEFGDYNITPNEPLRVKKGDYALSTFGEGLQPRNEAISLEHEQTVPVSFSYTEDRLKEIYQEEARAIRTALRAEYPSLQRNYTVSGHAVYQKGQFYGAKLTFRDKNNDNRDTLRVLMEKKDGEWTVRSNPPVPVLSAPDFTDVQPATLEAINRLK